MHQLFDIRPEWREGYQMKLFDRRQYVRDAGIATVLPSGAVKINWQKAVRSHLLRDEIAAMRRIQRGSR